MSASFLGSFVAGQELPASDGPQIAFLGRSNVGKSSLINLMTGESIARVSKTPGRTRMLNLFRTQHGTIFGDFPGYGFAKVSKAERKQWEVLIECFLRVEYFDYAIHIIDARHIGMDSDLLLNDWLNRRGIEHLIVLNKVDKLNQKEKAEAGREALRVFPGQPLLFASSTTKEGKRELEKILYSVARASLLTNRGPETAVPRA
jgi:GTP-binding protein